MPICTRKVLWVMSIIAKEQECRNRGATYNGDEIESVPKDNADVRYERDAVYVKGARRGQ